MFKSYKYRIYPTDTQKVLLDKHFGCVRFIYNLALETKIEAYKKGVSLSTYELNKQITDLKKDCVWLKEVSVSALQQSLINLDTAYKNFFKKRGNFPSFKKKRNAGSYTTYCVKIVSDRVYIPKFKGGINIIQHRNFEGRICSATISKTPTGKHFISILVEEANKASIVSDSAIGIDLGIKTFAVLSDGKEYQSPKFLRKSLDRLAVLQRRASRKAKGSANRIKANLKVALCHEKIYNQRNNFLHKVSAEIINQYGTICVEDLAVSNMVKNYNLALSISDAGWGELVRQLTYKADWNGCNLIKIGRFEPSTKKCSNCGSIKEMPLSERNYNCDCGLSIDRDLNAAINIRNLGILRTVEPVELPEILGTVKQESCRRVRVWK